MKLPDQSTETGHAKAAGQAACVDWEAIKAVTGYTDKQIETIQKTWNRPPQTMEEVWAGVDWERKMRLDSADKPGGLTDQIREAK